MPTEHIAVLEEARSALITVRDVLHTDEVKAAIADRISAYDAAIALMRRQSATGKLNGYMFREKAIEILMDSEIPMWMTNTPGIRVIVSPVPPQQEPAE